MANREKGIINEEMINDEVYIAEMQNEATKSAYKRQQRVYEEIEMGGNLRNAFVLE